MYRIVLAVGLTGGHIYPAKALVEYLGRENYRFLFVARTNSALAKRILEGEDYPVLPIDVEGFPRGLWRILYRGFGFIIKQIRALFLLWRVMVDWKPHLVIGFGGYVSFPAVLAAFLVRKPALIFEPNAKMGLANKVLKVFADGVVSTFDLGLADPRMIVPPLRRSMLEAAQLKKEDCLDFFGLRRAAPCVLVVGGSQGAHVLNQALSAVVLEMAVGNPFSFIHITGETDYQEIKNIYELKGLLGASGACLSYLEEMGKAYQAADLVISRAGAMTALELLYFKKPCVLIPLSRATESHQLSNARYLEGCGLARVIEESGSLKENLTHTLQEFLRGDGNFMVNHVKLEASGRAVKKTFKEVVDGLLKQYG